MRALSVGSERLPSRAAWLCWCAGLLFAGCFQQNEPPADDYNSDTELVAEEPIQIAQPEVPEEYITVDPPPAYEPAAPAPLTAEEWRAVADREPFERKKSRDPEAYKEPTPPDLAAEGFFDSLSTVAWVLVIALLAAGLAYAIYLQRRKPDLSISRKDYSATDALLNTAPDALAADLASKLGSRDYRMAIRLRFGQVLQELRSRRLLVWVPGATNLEYERALPPYLHADFASLAKDFAYATYAGKELDEARFERFGDKAQDFLLVAYSPNDPRRAAAVATTQVRV